MNAQPPPFEAQNKDAIASMEADVMALYSKWSGEGHLHDHHVRVSIIPSMEGPTKTSDTETGCRNTMSFLLSVHANRVRINDYVAQLDETLGVAKRLEYLEQISNGGVSQKWQAQYPKQGDNDGVQSKQGQ